MSPAPTVYIWHALADAPHHDSLRAHLAPLESNGWICFPTVQAGESISQIDRLLQTVDLLLVFVSSSFLATMPADVERLLASRERDSRKQTIPILLRPCLFALTPFGKLAPSPSNSKPVLEWNSADSAWLAVASDVLVAVGRRDDRLLSEGSSVNVDDEIEPVTLAEVESLLHPPLRPPKPPPTRRSLPHRDESQLVSNVQIVPANEAVLRLLSSDPAAVFRLTPGQFEEFVCDRLYAMGLEPKRLETLNEKKGGIDIVFWPRQPGAFPFLGAAQVKHRQHPRFVEEPSTVQAFAGAIEPHPFAAALLITNTSFSPGALWFARKRTNLLRCRDFADIKRWIQNDFQHDDEWREIPRSLELCPGVVIEIRRDR